MNAAWRATLGFVLGLLARCYLRTLRLRVIEDAALDRTLAAPWVLCFWHGEQAALLAWTRRRPTVALVSHSRDGQLQTHILARQGLSVERGSTSRGGARGLLRVVRRVARGCDAAFAIDGPCGPRHTVAPGALLAARRSGGVLVPMGSYAPHGTTLRSWDQLRFPRPWSRAFVRVGPPLPSSSTREQLAAAVARCSELARADAAEERWSQRLAPRRRAV